MRKKLLHFVIQKHAASHLHYDFRLEMGGVLKSWVLPKGPTLNPKNKRLAILVDDHDLSYKDFEGVIQEGYGAGAVLIWDTGTYITEGNPLASFKEGKISFTLQGEKLQGAFALVHTKGDQWLFMKKADEYATTKDILKKERSVISGRTIEEIYS